MVHFGILTADVPRPDELGIQKYHAINCEMI
jgi:hypothetical protein